MNLLHPRFCLTLYAICFFSARADESAHPSAIEPTISQVEAAQLAIAAKAFEKTPEAALQQLRAQTGPQTSAALDFALATLLAKKNQFAASQCALETAVEKFSSFQRAWLLLGRVLIFQGQTSRARQPLRKALALGADPAEVFKLLAFCHLAEGHTVAAESAYRSALVLVPEDTEILAGLARSLLQQSRYLEAESLLRNLCEHSPTNIAYWLLRADTELGQAHTQQALVLLSCARHLAPLPPSGLITLGDLYFNAGLYTKSTDCYAEAAATNALTPSACLRAVEALLEAHQPQQAEKLLATLPSEQSDYMHLLRAKLAATQNDNLLARKHLDAALNLHPLNGEALLMLARIQSEATQTDQAFLTLERAVRIESCRRRALLAMAQLAIARSDYEKTAEYLNEALSLQFDTDVARYLAQIREIQAAQQSDVHTLHDSKNQILAPAPTFKNWPPDESHR